MGRRCTDRDLGGVLGGEPRIRGRIREIGHWNPGANVLRVGDRGGRVEREV